MRAVRVHITPCPVQQDTALPDALVTSRVPTRVATRPARVFEAPNEMVIRDVAGHPMQIFGDFALAGTE